MKTKNYEKPMTRLVAPVIGDVLQIIDPGTSQNFPDESNKTTFDTEEDPITEDTGKSFWDN